MNAREWTERLQLMGRSSVCHLEPREAAELAAIMGRVCAQADALPLVTEALAYTLGRSNVRLSHVDLRRYLDRAVEVLK